jgi:hypothetical protein
MQWLQTHMLNNVNQHEEVVKGPLTLINLYVH